MYGLYFVVFCSDRLIISSVVLALYCMKVCCYALDFVIVDIATLKDGNHGNIVTQ